MSNFANIEISLQYATASRQNVGGICGRCSNVPKDGPATFIGKNNATVDNFLEIRLRQLSDLLVPRIS